MPRFSTAFHSYKYTQTTDGTDDYYVGIDGVNSFSITTFQGLNLGAMNALINFPSTVDSSTAVARILEWSNSTRTHQFAWCIGNFTTVLTNDYYGCFYNYNSGVTLHAKGITSAGSITAGWHMVSIVVEASLARLLIDGVAIAGATGPQGDVDQVTFGFTPDRMALMATTAGTVPLGCTWRDLAVFNIAPSDADMLKLYNYYTHDGNVSLANSRRTLARYLIYWSGSSIVELYKGNESGTDLLGSINSTAHKLTKTNF
jgi:hypothetical protein